jgi:uncharacterized protein (TIGR02646 family)
MRTIIKTQTPPSCLGNQPSGQDWGDFIKTPCHALVSDSLRKEQDNLCCYCEAEVKSDNSHVEHLVPRSTNAGLTYDYTNMASSCNGGNTMDHCGCFKDDCHQNPYFHYDHSLFCSPRNTATCGLFQYLASGDIMPPDQLPSQDKEKTKYMIGYLGLNCSTLQGCRHRHAKQLIKTLGANPNQHLIKWAVDFYLQPDSNGKLRQYHSLSRMILSKLSADG